MEEKILNNGAESKAAEISSEAEVTKQQVAEEVLIPIKFNKQERKLTLSEAATLAQKGLKFDAIEGDYKLLKDLALKEGKSVPQYLGDLTALKLETRRKELCEKCGGDEALVEHILSLEGKADKYSLSGFEELNAAFPEIKSCDELPPEVLEKATMSGRAVLDEYLRYLLFEEKRSKQAEYDRKAAVASSLGSQLNRAAGINPETAEFLKGLWR